MMRDKLFFRTLLVVCVILLVACGKKKNKDDVNIIEEQRSYRPEVYEDGTYRAILNPLNSQVGKHSGVSTIWVRGQQFYIRVKLDGGRAGVKHLQHIHSSGPCPTMADDVNRDGYIDAEEATYQTGKIIIPLDRDLNEQAAGLDGFPEARNNGSYFYSRAVDIQKMLAGLRGRDDLNFPHIVKLHDAEDFNILSRSIMVFSVSEEVRLPDTIANLHEYSRHTSLPVACGTITRAADQQMDTNL